MYSDDEIRKMLGDITSGMKEMYEVVRSTTGNLSVSSENLVDMTKELRGLNNTVTSLKNQVGTMAQSLVTLNKDVDSISGRMKNIEEKEEIETSKIDELEYLVSERVRELINEYNPVIRGRYTRDFRRRLWTDAKTIGLCGHRISMTKKENFEKLKEYVNNWTPEEGTAKFKEMIRKKWYASRGFEIDKVGTCATS